MDQDISCCWAHLAKYFCGFSDSATRWYPILLDVTGSFSSFLGLDFNLRFIPLLLKCGLVKERRMHSKKMSYVLSLTSTQKGYSWRSFIDEYSLVNVELTQSYISAFNQQIFLTWIGSFDVKPFFGKHFTPIEQYRDKIRMPSIKGNHQSRIQFVKRLAKILPLDIPQAEQDTEKKKEAFAKEVLGCY